MDTLCSIRLDGRCFPPGSELTLFPQLKANKGPTRLTIVFGRNGSGKSTLASALDDAAKGISNPRVSCALLTEDGTPCPNAQDILDSAYVFYEDYIRKRVVFSEGDHLDAIVLLGDTDELDKKLKSKENELSEVRTKLKDAQETLLTLSSHEKGSVANLRATALKTLKGSGSWADRDRRIIGSDRNSSVTDRVFDRLRKLQPSNDGLADLCQRFESDLTVFQSLSASEFMSELEMPSTLSKADCTELASLLGEKVEIPEVTGRDVRIIEIASDLGMSFMSEARDYFSTGPKEYCPYCMRGIDHGETDAILAKIELALRGDVQAHIERIKSLRPETCLIANENLPHLEEQSAVDAVINRLNEYNDVVRKVQAFCDQKAENPFEPVPADLSELLICSERLTDSISGLNGEVRTHNLKYNRRSELRSTLNALNDEIARLQMDDALSAWKVAEEEERLSRDEVESLTEALETLQDEVDCIKARLANTQIALDLINRYLAQIFMDDDHIVLKGETGRYRILSHGHPVRPSDVSAGERNAIALCSFIAEIGQGEHEEERFSKPKLLVLDDPISSFDYENKIGIITLIRNLVMRALGDCDETKILILTHDAQTTRSLRLLAKDVEGRFKGDAKRKLQAYGPVELVDGVLRDWSDTGANYTGLMNDVCAYARGERQELTPYIGNVTRRLLEGFATFEFNKGIEALAKDETILGNLPEGRRGYFDGLMARIALNDASHLANAVNDEGNVVTHNHYSPATLQSIARDSIELMYHLASDHVRSHLDEENVVFLNSRIAQSR